MNFRIPYTHYCRRKAYCIAGRVYIRLNEWANVFRRMFSGRAVGTGNGWGHHWTLATGPRLTTAAWARLSASPHNTLTQLHSLLFLSAVFIFFYKGSITIGFAKKLLQYFALYANPHLPFWPKRFWDTPWKIEIDPWSNKIMRISIKASQRDEYE